jgi:DNA polymerase-3 subunit delta'
MLLSKYEKDQTIASKTLVQAILNNKISHAYLFETNEYYDSKNFIISFVKDIICNNNDDDLKDNICKQIDNNEYIELKIINPQGLQIKKEEMLNLQDEFKSKPIEGKKKVYIINNAEKLNSSSANTILKFLEEPEEDIIAILVTSNRYQIIDTILSRCQLIALINTKKTASSSTFDKINNLVYNNSDLLEENQKKEQLEHAIDFISFYEEKKEETILFSNTEFMQYFITRDAVVNAFEIMKLFYLDSLKFITNTKIEIFNDYQEQILLVSRKNTVLSSIRKIKKIIKYIEKIKYNVNINLLLDRFIIELGDELDD